MRVLIELFHTKDERVEGTVIPEGGDDPHPFSGWLELLAVLGSLRPQSPEAPGPGVGARGG